MHFEITVVRDFSASHQLKLPDGSMETLHGHNWRLLVTVAANQLDSMGVVMDFHDLEHLLNGIIIPMHNHHLNDLPPFESRNPSAENVALYVVESLELPEHVRLVEVEARETENCRARWRSR